ncbi:glycosyltransferase [Sphingomonas sp. S1-29]|uniref:glycosyltransferase n=1 Tax=Sphingomonas sp. S1-29 TaxID=2991074 RepID=UPI00224069FF|nr:glycosyltransferase [Sphingomonas sp. S1-29]UZK68146.1 glycosyltransferase [Sphingomonas sp. S1-29]
MPTPPALHIASFVQTLAGGGVERALLRMADGWTARGHRVTLIAGDLTGPLRQELPEKVETVAARGAGYRDLMRAARGIGALGADIVFCPGNHYTAIALASRSGTRAPIVSKLSNALSGIHRPPIAWGNAAWLRLQPRFIDHLVAMTPAMAAEAERAMRMPPERISVIANPPARARGNAKPVSLPAGRFVLGVGRLAPQKRWDRLIAALPRLADHDVALVILGEGPMRPALADQAARLGVAHRVHLPGHAADPLPAMARAAVVALTSEHEGVPGVLREAIAQGTPVVSTDSSVAIPELVTSPALGTIVARDDEAALVAALDAWLSPLAIRPKPSAAGDDDPIGDYLALFGRLVAARA